MSSIPASECLELTRLFDQISTRLGAWTTTSIITTFLPIPDAIAFDLQTGCSIGGDFTRLLDRASKTLPEVTESTSILLRIRALFSRIRSYDPSIEEAFYFPDVKDKIEHPNPESFIATARAGDLTILQLYLENGAPISEKDRGMAVHRAALNGHEAVVSLLLAHGTISEEDRGIALGWAIQNGHEAVVSLLQVGIMG